MSQAPVQLGRTTTEKLLVAGGLIAILLTIVKASIIGYYPSEVPLLLIGCAVGGGLTYAAERMRKDRVARLDREHGIR